MSIGTDHNGLPCFLASELLSATHVYRYQDVERKLQEIAKLQETMKAEPLLRVPMLLWCPQCGERHIDVGEWATKEHHTHACQECGHVWRPAVVATVGVQFLPGFKNAP